MHLQRFQAIIIRQEHVLHTPATTVCQLLGTAPGTLLVGELVAKDLRIFVSDLSGGHNNKVVTGSGVVGLP